MTREDVGLKFLLTGFPAKHLDGNLCIESHKLKTPPPSQRKRRGQSPPRRDEIILVVRRKRDRSAKKCKRWRSQRSKFRLILQKQNKRGNPLLFIVGNNPTISLSNIKHRRGTDVLQDMNSKWMFRQRTSSSFSRFKKRSYSDKCTSNPISQAARKRRREEEIWHIGTTQLWRAEKTTLKSLD